MRRRLASPGLLSLPLRAPNPISYRWGFSVGAARFTFEHHIRRDRAEEAIVDPYDATGQPSVYSFEFSTNVLRLLAEARLGSSSERVFGYVLLGAGLAVLHVKASSSGSALDTTAGGFSLPLGAGIQALLGEHILVGFEPRFVVDVFGTGAVATFDARLILGARF